MTNLPPQVRKRTRSTTSTGTPTSSAPCNLLQNDDRRIAIAYVPIDAVSPPKRVLKKHSQRGMHALRASLRTHGIIRPILVDPDHAIVAGYGVWLAAGKLGFTEIPVVRIEHLTEAQLSAYAIADNQIANTNPFSDDALREALGELNSLNLAGALDFSMEVTGFTTSEIVSAWFARSGSLPEEPFKLDIAIEAAIRITNNCFPGCEATADIKGDATIDLPGKWLNPIVDLFCNCFQNAVEHGGHEAPQTIGFPVGGEEELSIGISNQLAEPVDAQACAARIAIMLKDAKNGDHRRATEEKGSGFCKVARIMKYDLPQGGSFDVAVIPDRSVEVRIVIPRKAIA